MSDLAWPTGQPTFDWAPPRPELIEVWVAVIVLQYQVSRKDIPATQPLTSGAMLFAPRVDETMTTARVVAAAATEGECREALDAWKRANPGLGGEEIISAVPFGRRDGGVGSPVASLSRCIDCGREIGEGFRCDACVKKYWQSLRDADPDYASQTA